MTTRHKITAAGYTITFSYLPSAGPAGPTYDSGGEPGYGPEIEYISHEPVSDYGPGARDEVEWCKDWLDDNAAECADSAERDLQPDPDAARDAAIDDRMTGER